jgi:hypothetical protein
VVASSGGFTSDMSASTSAQPHRRRSELVAKMAFSTTVSSASVKTSVSAASSCRRPSRHAMRRDMTASDCSPRMRVAAHVSWCIACHSWVYTSSASRTRTQVSRA